MKTAVRTLSPALAAALVVLALVAWEKQPPGAGGPGAVLEEFDVARGGDVLLLPVRLRGRIYPFLLDTGASNTLYDTSLRPLLGPPIRHDRVETGGGDITAELFEAPDASLGKISLRTGGAVGLVNLEGARQVVGREVYGILGMDVLGRYVIRIDCDRGKVAFLRSAPADSGAPVPLSFPSRGNPEVEARLAGVGRPVTFSVDTGDWGYSSGDLTPALFDELCRGGTVRVVSSGFCETLGGTVRDRRGRVKGVAVGGAEHGGLLLSTGRWNILGLGYWSRFVATFDFPGKTVYLKKGERFGLPDQWDRSGLHVLREGGAVVVRSVDPGSPAALGGIRPGDEVRKADGRDAADLSLFGLRRLLCASGRTVRLVVRRGGTDNEIPLPLGHWPEKTAAKAE